MLGTRKHAIFTVLAAVACAALGFWAGRFRRPPDPRDIPSVSEGKPKDREAVIRDFHQLFYRSVDQTWNHTFWLGVPALKCPLDLWVFQEILYENRPDWIIESGTFKGGSALYMATILDAVGKGRILSIDIEDFPGKPEHERITYLLGSSTSEQIVETIRGRIKPDEEVMVVLDSDHHAEHVLNELRLYGPMVTEGQYLVVEDSNVNGHPVMPSFGPGPMEALETFLGEDRSFEVDESREKFLLTFNPRGYLRKVR